MIAAIALLAVAIETPAPTSQAPVPRVQHQASAASKTQLFDQIAAAAATAWNDNRDEEAIRLSRQGLKLRPEWDEGLWYLGTIFYGQENYREARDQLRHYLARNPQNGVAWALVGLSDYKLREYEHASEDLQRALVLGLPGRQELAGPVYYYSALLLTRDERFEESAAYLYHLRRKDAGLHVDASLELPMGLNALKYAMLPEETPVDRVELARQVGMAVFARYEERREEAKSILSRLLKQFPGEQGLHFQYGQILLDEHSAEGIKEMEAALKLAPSNPEPRIAMAQYFIDMEQSDKAQTLLDSVLALDPTQPAARLLKGQILIASGDTPAAIAQFEIAKKSAPANTRVLWELMRAYSKAGRKEEAAQVLKEMEKLGLKPGDKN